MAVGPTFVADHSQNNGNIAESWIDHVYHSKELESQIQTEIINYGSSDHLPVTIKQMGAPQAVRWSKSISDRVQINCKKTYYYDIVNI